MAFDLSILPQISETTASLYRTLRGMHVAKFLSLPNSEEVAIELRSFSEDFDVSQETFSCLITAPTGEFQVVAPNGALDLICDLLLPNWRTQDSTYIFFRMRAIFFIEALVNLTPLAGSDYTIEIIDTREETAFPPIVLSIGINENYFPISLTILKAEEKLLEGLAPTQNSGPLPDKARVTVCVALPRFKANFGEVKDISVGDVVFLPGSYPEDIPVLVSIGGTIFWDGRCSESGECTIVNPS